MTASTNSLYGPRLAALFLAFAFAVVSAALGLNALIKSNKDKTRLKRLAPAPTRVVINTNDIYVAGTVATTASLLIAVLTFLFLAASLLPFTKAISNRTLRAQGGILILASLFLFGSMVPYMVFFVNRSAKVSAFIGNSPLPDSIVKSVEKASGSTSVYKHIKYLKNFAILPWIALLFTLIAAGVLFAAAAKPVKTTSSHGSSSPVMAERVDEPVAHHEAHPSTTTA